MRVRDVSLRLLKWLVGLLVQLADLLATPEAAATAATALGAPVPVAPAAWQEQVKALDDETRQLGDEADALAVAGVLSRAMLVFEELRTLFLALESNDGAAAAAVNFTRLVLTVVFQMHLRFGDNTVLAWLLPGLVIVDRRMAEACSDATYEQRVLKWIGATADAVADGDADGTRDAAEGAAFWLSCVALATSFALKKLLAPKAPWLLKPADAWRPVFRAGFDGAAGDWPDAERRALTRAMTMYFPSVHGPALDEEAFAAMPPLATPWVAGGTSLTILPLPAQQPLHGGAVAITVEGAREYTHISDDLRQKLELVIDPGFAVVIPVGKPYLLQPGAPSARLRGAYTFTTQTGTVRDPAGPGLQVDELRMELDVDAGLQVPALQVVVALRGLQLSVGGPLPVRGRGDLVLRYDTMGNRFTIEGGLGLEVRKRLAFGNVDDADGQPTEAPLGELTLLARLNAATVDGGYALQAELLADATLRLGRYAAVSVAGAGLRFVLRRAGPDGARLLGLADAGMETVAPTGIGIAITAGPIQGGGMLRVTPDRVSGVVELALGKKLHLSGVGQFDNRRRWLALVTLEIPASSPFIPRAIGLLIARGRQADAQALRAAVGTGELALVLTPRDVVANEARILAALDRFFPPGEGWLLGAMARFESKSGTFSASVGILANLPDDDRAPVELHLLAVAQLRVPSQPAWGLDGVGLWMLGRGEGYLFLKLRDAHLWGVTVSGSALIYHGDPDGDGPVGKATWISLGGFFPGYPVPGPALPSERLGLTWRSGDNVSLSITGYLAYTPASLQFGISAIFHASYSGFGFDGELSFDALVASDWSCQIDFHASLRFKVLGRTLLGVGVDCTFTALDRYTVKGAAHYEFLCFSGTKHFGCDLGERNAVLLAVAEAEQALADALLQRAAWRAPAMAGVVLSERERGVVLPPDGRTYFEQDIVPLDVTIELLGAQRLAQPRAFGITLTGASGAPQRTARLGEFAPGLYFDMTHDEALRAPVSVQHDNGFELQWPLRAGATRDVTDDWEEIIVDPAYVPPPTAPGTPVRGQLVRGDLLSTAFVAAPPPPPVVVRPAVFHADGVAHMNWMQAWSRGKHLTVPRPMAEPLAGFTIAARIVRPVQAPRAVLTEVWR